MKGKAQSEPHKRIERTIEDSELPIVQCYYFVFKDTAASDGLKVLSICVKSFRYGTSTAVEAKGATETFVVTWKVKMLKCLGLSDIILRCDPGRLIKWAESVKFKCQERTVTRSSPRRSHWSTGPSAAGKNFPKFEKLDAKIASALNKIIQNSQFNKKVSLEEQKAQKEDTRKTDRLHDLRLLSSNWCS